MSGTRDGLSPLPVCWPAGTRSLGVRATRLAPVGGATRADAARGAPALAWAEGAPPGGGRVQRWTRSARNAPLCSGTCRAHWRSHTPRPIPPPKRRKLQPSRRTASMCQPAGVPVRRMPQRPSRSMSPKGRDDEAAGLRPGGIMSSPIALGQPPTARGGLGADGQRSQTPTDGVGLSPGSRGSSPAPLGRGQWVDRPRHDRER
jgi:hypothetical protein